MHRGVAWLAQIPPLIAHGTTSKDTLMLLPAGTIYCGTAEHHYLVGEVQSAYRPILAQAGRDGKRAGTFG
jgi:hypothetical protein